jgi:glycerol-3-phosphate O-acyltransferase
MVPFDGLSQAWRWSVRKILRRLVRPTVKPDDVATAIAARPRPVCYVLETESQTDLAVLNNVCRQLRLPSPERRLALGGRRAEKAYFDLTGRMGFFSRRPPKRAPRYLAATARRRGRSDDFDVDLVPVAIFWGRAPHKEAFWRLLFADDWVLVGRFKKMLSVLFNGRNTLVYFGEPMRCARSCMRG